MKLLNILAFSLVYKSIFNISKKKNMDLLDTLILDNKRLKEDYPLITVGDFTTKFVPNQNRSLNIRRIADIVKLVLIKPGETFSLNGFVGKRTKKKGFLIAKMILNHRIVKTRGGGVSQFATTLFNSAFNAGLDITKYQFHSIYYDRYPYGLCATISWGGPDLRIRNNSSYPITIRSSSTNNSVRVEILAKKKIVEDLKTQQFTKKEGVCTNVTTVRTRYLSDDTILKDNFYALYRKEGFYCNGSSS